tara:strand:- start:77 stop:655 length:579 start_codon:yes stop_codon:yes gene_type:complete
MRTQYSDDHTIIINNQYENYTYYSIIIKSILEDIKLFIIYNLKNNYFNKFKLSYSNFIRKPIAITSTINNSKNYKDNLLQNDFIKYFWDDKNKDKDYIQVGAHFYHRNNTKSFTFMGIVKSISEPHINHTDGRFYYNIQLYPNMTSLNNLLPNTSVERFYPGGRGSACFARDAARDAGITNPANRYSGIIHL